MVVSVMFVSSVEVLKKLVEQSLAMILYLLVAAESIASFGLTNPYDMPELNQQLLYFCTKKGISNSDKTMEKNKYT